MTDRSPIQHKREIFSEGGEPTQADSSVSKVIIEEARRNGLLGTENAPPVSFEVPPALVEEAKQRTGISSTSELGVLALAMLARPDPFSAFLKRTRGRLGKDHKLDY